MNNSKDIALHSCKPFFVLAGTAFILTAFLGFLASLKVAFPFIEHSILPFDRIRPLHTLFPIVGVIAGSHAWISYATAKKNNVSLSKLSFYLILFFGITSTICLLLGIGSGREYFSWPPLLSIPLISTVSILVYLLYRKFIDFSSKSPEGAWLIGFGSVFILIGLIESLLWNIPSLGNNIVKDLTVQWHGIDTFFTGLNAFLYGVGILVLKNNFKPLRRKWLYIIAAFSLLFTFGHHHYISPQPEFLKILAFIASMIAMFSFLKHFKAYRKKEISNYASRSAMQSLFRSVEIWTIVSFASGILFAIPHVNTIVHGTFLIVIHSMGSMIGVQYVLVHVAGFSIFSSINAASEKRIKLGIKLLNTSLILMWLSFGIAGLIKGYMRFDHHYIEINHLAQYALYFLPVLGAILLSGIYLISSELIKNATYKK